MASVNMDFVMALASLGKWRELSKNWCPYGETCCVEGSGKEAEAFGVLRDGLLSDDAGPWVCLFYLAENPAIRQVEISRRMGVRRQTVARWLSRALEIAPGMRRTIAAALAETNSRGRVQRKSLAPDFVLPGAEEDVEEVDV